MIHNETINIWVHLIGMLIFVFLMSNTFYGYEPSDFYYHNLINKLNSKEIMFSFDFDIGVPF